MPESGYLHVSDSASLERRLSRLHTARHLACSCCQWSHLKDFNAHLFVLILSKMRRRPLHISAHNAVKLLCLRHESTLDVINIYGIVWPWFSALFSCLELPVHGLQCFC
ncbi:hypothetical protein BDU57DRAFT_514694 [Ampelomyces quisqualis]|uniref:Uncharacterized protein n=1 Tax=Ampelomyces quisqualis TaxID=50730 RepID=A0A6A5QU55_AMPQU|nr:hypothetical protein BDU57DRAFT_514694 [Ampelomyces quisqualis]